MIQPVASQQSRPGIKTRQRRQRMTEPPSGERLPQVQTDQKPAGIAPIVPVSKPLPRRLRLVGDGRDPARKIWRLKMIDSTEAAIRLPGLNRALRIWSVARALL